MAKKNIYEIKESEIRAAIYSTGGIEQLGEALGITGRQVRNYLKYEKAPKLACEAIKAIGAGHCQLPSEFERRIASITGNDKQLSSLLRKLYRPTSNRQEVTQ